MTRSIDCKMGVPYSNHVVKIVIKCKDDDYHASFNYYKDILRLFAMVENQIV